MLAVDETYDAGGSSTAVATVWQLPDQVGTSRSVAVYDATDSDGTAWDVLHRGLDESGQVAAFADVPGDALLGDTASAPLLASRVIYAGHRFDEDLGLYDMRARWYDPATQRFLSEDPTGQAGSGNNLYQYAGGDPVNNVDPTGLASIGHHFVPQSVTNDLLGSLTRGAIAVFRDGTSGALPYRHGLDPWNGVSHIQYNNAVKSILGRFIENADEHKLVASSANEFLDYVKGIKGKKEMSEALQKAVNTSPEAAKAISAWRKGFFASTKVGQAAVEAAKNRGITLSPEEVKAVAQQRVNGKITTRKNGVLVKTKNVDLVLDDLNKLKPSQWRRLKILGLGRALGVAGFALSTSRGYAGSLNGNTGALGAVDQALADLVYAEEINNYLLDPIGEHVGEYVDHMLDSNISRSRIRDMGLDRYGQPLK